MKKTFRCSGWWEQRGLGRQPMQELLIETDGEHLFGRGTDAVGEFTVRGRLSGDSIRFVKQYVGRHAIAYGGISIGEGMFEGEWIIEDWNRGRWFLHFQSCSLGGGADPIKPLS